MEEKSDNQKRDKSYILVVDDEKDIQNFIRFKLQKIGYNVFIAQNGQEAIEKVKKIRPDLILLDILMPVMDGFKTCEYIKNHKEFKHIPIIFVSALGDIRDKALAYGYGADDYLTKPIDIITMAARVKSILETQKLRDKIRRQTDKKAITNNLFDYQHLFERLETELEHSRRKSKPLSIIYLDIDYMKIINSKYGLKKGDLVIKIVKEIVYDKLFDIAIILSSNIDKLFIILPNISENKIHVIADDILEKIKQIVLPFDIMINGDMKLTKITASLGIVTWDKIEGVSSEKLLSLVEKALKSAKNEGRGKKVQYQFYSKPSRDGKHVIDKKIVKNAGRKK